MSIICEYIELYTDSIGLSNLLNNRTCCLSSVMLYRTDLKILVSKKVLLDNTKYVNSKVFGNDFCKYIESISLKDNFSKSSLIDIKGDFEVKETEKGFYVFEK